MQQPSHTKLAITKYNFDFGAITWAQTPSPNVGQSGPTQTMTYDSAARIQQMTNGVNGAYVRYVYTAAGDLQTYSTIQNGAGEAYSVAYFDGAGRVRATAAENPGSSGGYSAQFTYYDVRGRVSQQTNPAEINAAGVPSGDDAAGWFSTLQTYDWKGRPLLTTNPDGSTRENTYGGCGCAGGEQTTVRDENGRRKRYTKDVLGRLVKVEELNWDQTVYSTTNYTLNVRDQITTINQEGQTRTFGYDGYGRLATRTTPEQGTTTYTYFADDRTQTVTDARGATTTFAYNNRGLVTSLTYGVPSGVAATPNVSFGYDGAGNRTSMTDGLGSVSYVYNSLSQLTSESRNFTGLGSYTLSYGYNLSGELNSITNQWGAQVGYGYDKTGRPTNVSGSGYVGLTSYVNSMSYRAFGGLKQMAYNNSRTLSLQYDNRMRPTQWSIPGVLRMQYSYLWEQSGRLEFARNLDDETLDRWFAYDHVGRLSTSRSGNEARLAIGEQVPLLYNGPYSHGIQYDKWGNMTYREGWGGENYSFTATYVNNKRVGLTYDAAGNITNDGGQNFTYDVTGQQATASSPGYLLEQYYDGDGLRVKKRDYNIVTYYLRSTLLGGQVVAELNGSGTWQRGYVYLGEQLLAVQQSGVYWVHQDPLVKSKRVTDSSGTIVSTVELDPWGGNTNRSSNDAFQPHRFNNYERDINQSDEAMFRRYNRWWSRFDQPDPYDGSYDLGDPQSFNRFAYVRNDPVNFVDPTGLEPQICGVEYSGSICTGMPGFWGGGFNMNSHVSLLGSSGRQTITDAEYDHDYRYFPENGPFRFVSAFGAMSWLGWFSLNRAIPCESMARNAQNDANFAILQNEGANAAAVAAFDITFSAHYLGRDSNGKGRTMESFSNVVRYAKGGSRSPMASGNLLGQADFQDRFKEVSPYGDAMDQTHHVAAYMSLGINNRPFTEFAGERLDRLGGAPDRLLGAHSYVIGEDLRRNPSGLKNIGNTLRNTFCNP